MNSSLMETVCATVLTTFLSSSALAQPVPQTWFGVPNQIIPQFQETGAPSFTTPLGSATNPGVVSAGSGQPSSGGGGVGGSTATSSSSSTAINSPTTGSTAAVGNGSSVIYTNPDGTTSTLAGGSVAWRNNNPGNIIYNSYSQSQGAIGQNNGFAVFPDLPTGTTALTSLLQTPGYQNLSVNAAIARYAPPSENNTGAYQAAVTSALGVSGTTLVSSLSAAQMQTLQGAVQTKEGYTPGSVSHS